MKRTLKASLVEPFEDGLDAYNSGDSPEGRPGRSHT